MKNLMETLEKVSADVQEEENAEERAGNVIVETDLTKKVVSDLNTEKYDDLDKNSNNVFEYGDEWKSNTPT